MRVVLDDTKQRALITDTETGQVLRVSVPTAKENVENGRGRYVHGVAQVEDPKPDPAPAPEPTIALTDPDVLPLPEPEPEPRPDQDKRASDIAAALDLLGPDDMVKSGVRTGRPKCSSIEAVVGYPVFVDEVDPIWNERPAD